MFTTKYVSYCLSKNIHIPEGQVIRNSFGIFTGTTKVVAEFFIEKTKKKCLLQGEFFRWSSVRQSSRISLNISFQTDGPIWTKLRRCVPWEVLYKDRSQNLIPSKTLVAMAMKWNFLTNSLETFSRTPGQILN